MNKSNEKVEMFIFFYENKIDKVINFFDWKYWHESFFPQHVVIIEDFLFCELYFLIMIDENEDIF
jgi:hypothetical protein